MEVEKLTQERQNSYQVASQWSQEFLKGVSARRENLLASIENHNFQMPAPALSIYRRGNTSSTDGDASSIPVLYTVMTGDGYTATVPIISQINTIMSEIISSAAMTNSKVLTISCVTHRLCSTNSRGLMSLTPLFTYGKSLCTII